MAYMKHSDRRAHILKAALKVARTRLFTEMTQTDVAKAASCSASLIRFYFGSMDDLKNEVMREAIRVNDNAIIAQGIVLRHPKARRLPDEVKNSALAAL